MASNVIDSAERFRRNARQSAPRSVIEKVTARSPRVSSEDRLMISRKLGELAAQLDPEHPDRPAKRWFSKWDGDRWNKRKKFIQFPGEKSRDPSLPGQIAANSGDWTGLINAAAEDCHPGSGIVAERDRERLRRQILRGTTYLPEVDRPNEADFGAQDLLQRLADKICTHLRSIPGLTQLWQALDATPFQINWAGNSDFAGSKYDSDTLEAASRGASEIADLIPWSENQRYDQDDKYRFGAESILSAEREGAWGIDIDGQDKVDWSFPRVRLGLIGIRRDARIFEIPNGFISLAASDSDPSPDPAHAASDWLCAKGIWGPDDLSLPEVAYDAQTGFGWKPFSYDIVREVWLECRPKTNGEPGLWMTISQGDELSTRFYPVLSNLDCLAVEAACPPVMLRNLPFSPVEMGGLITDAGYLPSDYELLEWPASDPVFYPDGDGSLLGVALSGLIERQDADDWLSEESIPDSAGWLDDLDNHELQSLIFRNPRGARFLPSIAVDEEAPLPCRAGTIAGALFANLVCLADERVASELASAAERISQAGLAFHNELLGHYHQLMNHAENSD
jgi:hypothetical protein